MIRVLQPDALANNDSTLEWIEPVRFRLRSASWKWWILRACYPFVLLLGVALFFDRTARVSSVVQMLVYAISFILLCEVWRVYRRITINQHGIQSSAASNDPRTFAPLTTVIWNRFEIESVSILPEAEYENGCDVMKILLKHAPAKYVGIAPSVSTDLVIERIRKLGIPVQQEPEETHDASGD